jgi:hypothetical protein
MGFMSKLPKKEIESQILQNQTPDVLKMNEFEGGKFFNVVFADESRAEIELTSKTKIELTYRYKNNKIEGLKLSKIIDGKYESLYISCFDLNQLKAFVDFISKLNLAEYIERTIKLSDENRTDTDDEILQKFKSLLQNTDGVSIIEEVLNNGLINSKDIVNTGYRKKQLRIYFDMLEDVEMWKSYSKHYNLSSIHEEKSWQHFFTSNPWIFGYGLDYRYNQILQREAHISDNDVDGTNNVITDFLLGDSQFVTFVELKKPTTPLFGKAQQRSNAWTLSNELFDSVSQILEQKASGIIKFEKPQYDSEGNIINQKSFDSKVILVIGNWNELDSCNSDREKEIKKKTFELFRRDSRNIEIITYDELFARANFIVNS